MRNASHASPAAKPSKPPVRLGIALQGGGSYGAYAKGVLTTLLENAAFASEKLTIKAITGTSAGAVNGALAAYGLNKGGNDMACDVLQGFWRDISERGRMASLMSVFNPLAGSVAHPNLPHNIATIAGFLPKGYVTRELAGIINSHITDWDALQNGAVQLFVNAVEQESDSKQRIHKVFTGNALNADTITASGALAELGGHVIDGTQFYDGAYWRNPCFSDIKKQGITDLLVVTLQKTPPVPVTSMHQDDLRAMHPNPGHQLMTQEIHHHLAHLHKNHPEINLHVISLDVQPEWNDTSRMNTSPRWLAELENMGYNDAGQWIQAHAAKLGKTSSYEKPAPPVAQNNKPARIA